MEDSLAHQTIVRWDPGHGVSSRRPNVETFVVDYSRAVVCNSPPDVGENESPASPTRINKEKLEKRLSSVRALIAGDAVAPPVTEEETLTRKEIKKDALAMCRTLLAEGKRPGIAVRAIAGLADAKMGQGPDAEEEELESKKKQRSNCAGA